MDDDPAEWPCLDDRLQAYLNEHPDSNLDDAIEALIWGEETDDADE